MTYGAFELMRQWEKPFDTASACCSTTTPSTAEKAWMHYCRRDELMVGNSGRVYAALLDRGGTPMCLAVWDGAFFSKCCVLEMTGREVE